MSIRLFLWIGNGKDILVPFKEQARPMEKETLFGLPLYG
jgi:hypothetical protein